MWTCPRCRTENKDGSAVCVGCGAPRSARRFGSAAPVDIPPRREDQPAPPPRVRRIEQTAPARELRPAPNVAPAEDLVRPAPPAPRANYAPPEAPAAPESKALTFVGALLCVLLPLLTLLFAWRQYDALSGALLPLLLGGASLPDVVKIVIYAALSLIAALVALLPGLGAMALGRVARSLRRIENHL